MFKEHWKAVKGYDGMYEVSTAGRVRSWRKQGRLGGCRREQPKLLKQTPNSNGYLSVVLSLNGCQKTKTVHRLVAEAFIDNPRNYRCVRHLNDDPLDNRLENLAWGSQKMNMADARRNGIQVGGHNKKDFEAAELLELALLGLTQQAIADQVGCGQRHVSKIINRKKRIKEVDEWLASKGFTHDEFKALIRLAKT